MIGLNSLSVPSGAANADAISIDYDSDSKIYCATYVDEGTNDVGYIYFCVHDGHPYLVKVQDDFLVENATAFVTAVGDGKFAIWNGGGTNGAKLYINQAPWTDTNADDWIGVAQETVADTESVNVELRGSLDANQTGLSGNNRYYLADDGSLTTTKNDRYLGRALSATELLLLGET